MRSINISLLLKGLLVLGGIGFVAGDFSYPPPTEKVTFMTGVNQTIRFETEWEEYSIALYQQDQQDSSTKQGPTLIEKQDGAGRHKFDWPVDLYGFRLDDSETFFFWIFQGDASNQGDLSKYSMASPLFTIAEAGTSPEIDCQNDFTKTEVDPTSTSSLFLVSETSMAGDASGVATTSRSKAPAGSTLIPRPTSVLAGLSSQSSSATSAPSPSSTGNLKAEGLEAPKPAKSPPSAASTSPEPDNQDSHGSLSAMSKETKIGIGVGVGFGGAALIGGLAFLIFKQRAKGGSRGRSTAFFGCVGLLPSRLSRNSRVNAEC